jgi:hypothetical protein
MSFSEAVCSLGKKLLFSANHTILDRISFSRILLKASKRDIGR